MASIFRREGAWVIKWKDARGRWLQRRTTCATRAETQTLARELERKVEFQTLGLEPIERPVTMTFGELLDWYSQHFASGLRSKNDLGSGAKHLRPALGALPLNEVTPATIEALLSSKASDLSPKSLNNLRGFIQTVFSKALRREMWKGVNPALAVERRRVPNRIPSYLKPEEVTAMLREVPTQWRSFFACAVYTGLRRGELVALQKRDVDLEAQTITVCRSWKAATTKGGHADLPDSPRASAVPGPGASRESVSARVPALRWLDAVVEPRSPQDSPRRPQPRGPCGRVDAEVPSKGLRLRRGCDLV